MYSKEDEKLTLNAKFVVRYVPAFLQAIDNVYCILGIIVAVVAKLFTVAVVNLQICSRPVE